MIIHVWIISIILGVFFLTLGTIRKHEDRTYYLYLAFPFLIVAMLGSMDIEVLQEEHGFNETAVSYGVGSYNYTNTSREYTLPCNTCTFQYTWLAVIFMLLTLFDTLMLFANNIAWFKQDKIS